MSEIKNRSLFLGEQTEEDLEIFFKVLQSIRDHSEYAKMVEIVEHNMYEEAIPFEGGICIDEALTLVVITLENETFFKLS